MRCMLRKRVKGQLFNASMARPRRRFIRLRFGEYTEKQLRDAANNAKASLQIEGFTFLPEEERFLMQKSRGKLSQIEFLKKAKELARHV